MYFTVYVNAFNYKRESEKCGDRFVPTFDGKTPSLRESGASDRFNGGENNRFLISLKAGGVGLNLTGADTVIHYDPWWNPAVMEQASDRAYRIGQTKAVQVIRLAAKGTIEEKYLNCRKTRKILQTI